MTPPASGGSAAPQLRPEGADGEPLGGQVSVSEAFQPVADAAPAVPGTDMVYDPLTGGFRKA